MHQPFSLLALALAASFGAACASGGSPVAPPPKRPTPQKLPPKVVNEMPVPADCAPQEPRSGAPAKAYKQRDIDGAQAHADQGLAVLVSAEKRDLPEANRNAKVQQAVAKFHTALAADPYNVRATYNLAAAYARIGRRQCSLNLLARLAQMRSFHSQRDKIEDVVDRLFGRGKWKGRPDPDFAALRDDQTFRAIASKL